MKKFFPSYGDRIAISDFVRRAISTSQRKRSLLDRLRTKLENKKRERKVQMKTKTKIMSLLREVQVNTKSKILQIVSKIKNKKMERLIEIGWLHDDGDSFKQVRFKNGGGTLKIKVSVSTTKQELIEEGKTLFFPSGKSAQ